MALQTPLINGISYSYSQVRITVGGSQIFGVSSITWETEKEYTNEHAIGTDPVSRGAGIRNVSGTIELDTHDVEILRDNSPGKVLTDLAAFDIVVIYENSQRVLTKILKNVNIAKETDGGSTGDTNMKKTLDLVISHVENKG